MAACRHKPGVVEVVLNRRFRIMRNVCQLTASINYYFHNELVDMRKSYDGLSGIVVEEFGRYPLNGEAFVFIGKKKNISKILHREGNGLTLYCRRLDKGCFQMPEISGDGAFCDMTYQTFTLFELGQKTGSVKHYPLPENMVTNFNARV